MRPKRGDRCLARARTSSRKLGRDAGLPARRRRRYGPRVRRPSRFRPVFLAPLLAAAVAVALSLVGRATPAAPTRPTRDLIDPFPHHPDGAPPAAPNTAARG